MQELVIWKYPQQYKGDVNRMEIISIGSKNKKIKKSNGMSNEIFLF